MNNNAIFSKSILCALALFGFSSATAANWPPRASNVIFSGSSTSKTDLIKRMKMEAMRHVSINETVNETVNEIVTARFFNSSGQCREASIWDTIPLVNKI
ncbi:MAG: hypothetical protein LBJ96_01170 [Holosporaceae bacterium]|jgi:hypothetical protein|nr:hypothetical protein [Holosporaceae bacterium]